MMLLMENEEMKQKIIEKMMENGNQVYEDIKQSYQDV